MLDIPAFCDKCGQPRPSGVHIADSTYHLKDQEAGRCPCGGTMRLLDGTYSHLGGPLNFCRAPEEDVARFRAACRQLGVPVHG